MFGAQNAKPKLGMEHISCFMVEDRFVYFRRGIVIFPGEIKSDYVGISNRSNVRYITAEKLMFPVKLRIRTG